MTTPSEGRFVLSSLLYLTKNINATSLISNYEWLISQYKSYPLLIKQLIFTFILISILINATQPFFQMKTFLILATVALVSVKANVLLPAGVDPKSCPNYPYCSNAAPAALPTPVVNGQPVAPILNTTPEQTAFYQQVSLWV